MVTAVALLLLLGLVLTHLTLNLNQNCKSEHKILETFEVKKWSLDKCKH